VFSYSYKHLSFRKRRKLLKIEIDAHASNELLNTGDRWRLFSQSIHAVPLSQVVLGLLLGANIRGQRAQTPIVMVMA
jgi:hypothetical protein